MKAIRIIVKIIKTLLIVAVVAVAAYLVLAGFGILPAAEPVEEAIAALL